MGGLLALVCLSLLHGACSSSAPDVSSKDGPFEFSKLIVARVGNATFDLLYGANQWEDATSGEVLNFMGVGSAGFKLDTDAGAFVTDTDVATSALHWNYITEGFSHPVRAFVTDAPLPSVWLAKGMMNLEPNVNTPVYPSFIKEVAGYRDSALITTAVRLNTTTPPWTFSLSQSEGLSVAPLGTRGAPRVSATVYVHTPSSTFTAPTSASTDSTTAAAAGPGPAVSGGGGNESPRGASSVFPTTITSVSTHDVRCQMPGLDPLPWSAARSASAPVIEGGELVLVAVVEELTLRTVDSNTDGGGAERGRAAAATEGAVREGADDGAGGGGGGGFDGKRWEGWMDDVAMSLTVEEFQKEASSTYNSVFGDGSVTGGRRGVQCVFAVVNSRSGGGGGVVSSDERLEIKYHAAFTEERGADSTPADGGGGSAAAGSVSTSPQRGGPAVFVAYASREDLKGRGLYIATLISNGTWEWDVVETDGGRVGVVDVYARNSIWSSAPASAYEEDEVQLPVPLQIVAPALTLGTVPALVIGFVARREDLNKSLALRWWDGGGGRSGGDDARVMKLVTHRIVDFGDARVVAFTVNLELSRDLSGVARAFVYGGTNYSDVVSGFGGLSLLSAEFVNGVRLHVGNCEGTGWVGGVDAEGPCAFVEDMSRAWTYGVKYVEVTSLTPSKGSSVGGGGAQDWLLTAAEDLPGGEVTFSLPGTSAVTVPARTQVIAVGTPSQWGVAGGGGGGGVGENGGGVPKAKAGGSALAVLIVLAVLAAVAAVGSVTVTGLRRWAVATGGAGAKGGLVGMDESTL